MKPRLVEGLHKIELEASLAYMRPCLTKERKKASQLLVVAHFFLTLVLGR